MDVRVYILRVRPLAALLRIAPLNGPPPIHVQNGRNHRGHQVSLLASAALLGAMGPRFIKTRKVFPPGVLSLAAAGTAYYEYKQAQEWSGF